MCKIENRELIVFNLNQARGELSQIIKLILDDNHNISEEEFKLVISQIYHYLNYAWNIRNSEMKGCFNLSKEDTFKFSKFLLMAEYAKLFPDTSDQSPEQNILHK